MFRLFVLVFLLNIDFLNAQDDIFLAHRMFHNSILQFPKSLGDDIVLNVSDKTVRFFALGDWGGLPVFPYRTIVEQNVALYMARRAKELNIHFQLTLGDNFYFNGVTNSSDKRFIQTFEDVFTEKSLDTPWFMLLGNHDHYGNASAQIEYSKQSKKWIMPDYNYTVSINTNVEKLIKILVIDTVLLCGNSGYDWNVNKITQTLEEKIKASVYLKWIESKLKQISVENYRYVIVAGHFPVWSVGEHGPTKCLVENLRPLLHVYNISAYFAGHEHDMEHLTDTYLNSTVEYIVSGASNFPKYTTAHINDVPPDSLKFYWSNDFQLNGAVALVEADVHQMNITYLETSGKTLYTITIKSRF